MASLPYYRSSDSSLPPTPDLRTVTFWLSKYLLDWVWVFLNQLDIEILIYKNLKVSTPYFAFQRYCTC